MLTRNIVTNHGAVGDGVTNDSAAFISFQTWAIANQGTDQITLIVPARTYFIDDNAGYWVTGIKNLIVSGYGATLSSLPNMSNLGFRLGCTGFTNDAAHSAKIATVVKGSSTVILSTLSDKSKLTVGNYILLSGLDLQGGWQSSFGYPPNWHYFEYLKISAIDNITGVITFTTPLRNSYFSTWPQYDVSQGGPGTIWVLPNGWDMVLEYKGLIISQVLGSSMNGRDITFRDVTFTGNNGPQISQDSRMSFINVDASSCFIEADKEVETLIFDNTDLSTITFQSSSIDEVQFLNGCNVSTKIEGTPKRTIIKDSSVVSLRLGATAAGRSDFLYCENSVISAIDHVSVIEEGSDNTGIQNTYSMSNGVITSLNTRGATRFGVPETQLIWAGSFSNESTKPFRITGVTQDGTNTYLQTNWIGGFPGVPTQSGDLKLKVHPAPICTFINCIGCPDAIDLSQSTYKPIYNYTKRLYNGTGIIERMHSWGTVLSIKINVITPYTGSQGTLTLRAMNQSTIKNDYSLYQYDPVINLKIAGERIITPSGVTGTQTGDSGLALPETLWFANSALPTISANISGESSSVWPSFSIEIITDQGVSYKIPIGLKT